MINGAENRLNCLKELIDLFSANYNQYMRQSYDESNLRTDFVDKFFEILGWDVRNLQGYSEQYREVVREDKVEIKGKMKAPDYSFRIGGVRKFFVEAKKPSVDIKSEIAPAFQLRRYAYTADMPLSILTDFHEFAVYDTRIKPDHRDAASVARVFYCTFKEYLEHFEFIHGTFSKEAILKGSFNRYVDENRRMKGTSEVDREFLKLIEKWRQRLAKNIALRNQVISIYELKDAVQRTIDRILFLRIAEDRGIESYGRLQKLTEEKGEPYPHLVALFSQAERKYNSGLFDFKKDRVTPGLRVDDRILREIVRDLYYPECPYEFSVMPVEILGNIYEQFLGKTIKLTEGHHAKVEDKPEVKKAGGVFYTPKYIVDYIVKNTVGKIAKKQEGRTQGSAHKEYPIPPIKILDPACGSGSFLLGAYQHLLDAHLEHYMGGRRRAISDRHEQLQKSLKAGKIYLAGENEYRLTIDEKRRILLDHIHGVDIDRQAMEVTKLSLMLKLLEGESQESAGRLFKYSDLKLLPDLSGNIKCGNSLIGSDFYDDAQMDLFADEEAARRVNVFDWKKEFPHVFEEGGFDVVIGNPPYVRQEMLGEFKQYFSRKYQVFNGTADLYTYFIEKGIALLRPGGMFGYIVANKWMRANYGEPLRRFLKTKRIVEIIDFGDLPVFQGATTYPCILLVENSDPKKGGTHPLARTSPSPTFPSVSVKTLAFGDLEEYVAKNRFEVDPQALGDAGWTLADEKSQRLLKKLRDLIAEGKAVTLEDYVQGKIFYGIKTGLNEAFVIDEDTKKRLLADCPDKETRKATAERIKPFLLGRDIKRYHHEKGQYLIFFPKGFTNANLPTGKDPWKWLQKEYPTLAEHLSPFEEAAKKRYDKGEYWWELRACDYYAEFEKPKIIYPNICKKPEFTFDQYGLFTNQKCFIISIADKYLLGVLNSSLNNFLFQKILPKLRGDFYEPSYVFFKDFPIRRINLLEPEDVKIEKQIIEMVEKILDLNNKCQNSQIENEKNLLSNQIYILGRKIDRLVYELYGLTDEEIKIVEGNDE